MYAHFGILQNSSKINKDLRPFDIKRRTVRPYPVLLQAGFVNRGGKGSHRNFVHPKVPKPISISGKTGDDALHYQERSEMLHELDNIVKEVNISRQDVIKMYIRQAIDQYYMAKKAMAS